MASRITFQGRGCVESDGGTPPAVSILEPRVKFIKGWLTSGDDPLDGSVECGSGTSYPLKVTADQLAEIFYRVKKARFTTGDVTRDGYRLFFNNGSWPSQNVQTIESWWDGYQTYGVAHGLYLATGTSAPDDAYTDAGDLAKIASYLGASYSNNGAYFRDAGIDELAFWAEFSSGSSIFETPGANCSVGTGYDFGPGFSSTLPSLAGFYSFWPDGGEEFYYPYGGANGYVTFQHKVAWVSNGSDDPLDPTSELWIALLFAAGNTDITVSTNKTWSAGILSLTDGFEVELSGGALVKADLYGVGDESYSESFRLKAVEWWPYKTTAGDPAWDATGLPANGGPGA